MLNQRGFQYQFKPKKTIGGKHFGLIYLAEKLETGKNFAVKAISKEEAYSDCKGKEFVIKEIEIMRNISHIYGMKLYEVFESKNSLYMVV